ncbi:MAG: hypothetical protein JRH15_10135 [Deltaproteobacteria bacterium]|nr:hypothetical protein [Deltaproteobacteria bacterium]
MANQFLVDIHQFIVDQLACSRQAIKSAKACGNTKTVNFHEGRVEEFLVFRKLIDENFNLNTQSYY